MGEVIDIFQKKFFTLEEAKSLLPVVKRLTEACIREIDSLSVQLEYLPQGQRRIDVEAQAEQAFQAWVEKMEKIGCVCKGMWLVDFDSGEGYYCWQHGEPELSHFHGYEAGFTGRVKIC